MEVGATALHVGLAAIAPEDGVRRNASRARSRLLGCLGVNCCPLLVVAQPLLSLDPLGRLLSVAAATASLELEVACLGINVNERELAHLIILDAVCTLLVTHLSLLQALGALRRRLDCEGSGLLAEDDVRPGTGVAERNGDVQELDDACAQEVNRAVRRLGGEAVAGTDGLRSGCAGAVGRHGEEG